MRYRVVHVHADTRPTNRWVFSSADMYVSLPLSRREASGGETKNIVEGVERDEVEDISGIIIVCPGDTGDTGDIVSTRPSGPALLRMSEYGDQLNKAKMAKKTILALLREAAALTADAADVRRARGS